jgi:hypothetical protein
VGRHVGGSAGLEIEIRRGRRVVDILDTIVRDAFRGNDEVLAKWRVAKRVQGVPGGVRAGGRSDSAPDVAPVALTAA